MERYVSIDQCERTATAIKSRIKWLAAILGLVLGVTALAAEQSWEARSGFDDIHSKLERQTGVSDTRFEGIQRSLDRIDRKLESQEAALHQLLQASAPHVHEP